MDRGGEARAHRMREKARSFRERETLKIPVIAGEDLVSPVARQRDRHMTPSHLGHKVCWNFRGIGEWLVVDLRELRDDGACLGRGHVELGMFGTKMGGDALG